MIDDTRPKTNSQRQRGGRCAASGLAPLPAFPNSPSNGIARDDYLDAVLTFNGRAWTVRSYELRGSPNGEDLGEVRFLLKAIESSDG